jgi:hypothetical protein
MDERLSVFLYITSLNDLLEAARNIVNGEEVLEIH